MVVWSPHSTFKGHQGVRKNKGFLRYPQRNTIIGTSETEEIVTFASSWDEPERFGRSGLSQPPKEQYSMLSLQK